MTTIKQDDFIESIADALQYISYYHSTDYIDGLVRAYEAEEAPAARQAIEQILINSRMCAEGHRPLCQDTGIVIVFLKIGMAIQWDTELGINEMVNRAVRLAYTNKENPLRASIVSDPAGERKNTGDNTPAVIHTEVVPGDKIHITVAAKGGGSENKAQLAMLNPDDDIVEWVLNKVPLMGAGWCPPGILGIGIGGSAEKAMLLAKESLMAPIDILALKARGAKTSLEALRLELYEKVNALGIGAQGLGGLTTVMDVKILDYPTHATSKPIALIPNCAATRHISFDLTGEGPARLDPPDLSHWPNITWKASPDSLPVNLDTLTRKDISLWKAGETLLLSGTLLTGRDAAHKRIAGLIADNKPLPDGLDFTNRFIYYVGPVDPTKNETIGPAGPTTATRMDKFTDVMLEKTGLLGMIGKAERGPDTIKSIKQHRSVYMIATGGAAYLISKAIKSARVIAFPELGMEAVYEFKVKDMPVTVAVDSTGDSIHHSGPAEWRNHIAGIPVKVN